MGPYDNGERVAGRATMKIDVILGAGRTAAEVEELGALADGYGLHAFWNQSFPSRREPLLTMAGLAHATRGIRLGTMPVSPYEVHPLRLADSLLTFNEMCGGRGSVLIGGLGHSVMRVTALEPVRRVAAVRDCVSILTGISPERTLDYAGECYSLLNYRAEWARHGPPRVYVGSTGPQMLAMAAEVADGIMMSDVPLGRMGEVLGHVGRGLERAGRARGEVRLNNFFAWHIKADGAAALREARRELIWRGLLQSWHTAPFLGAEDAAFVESRKDAFLRAFLAGNHVIDGVPDGIITALVDNLAFAGGPDRIDRVAEHLGEFARAGLDEAALKVHDDPADAIRLIGERLVPALD
jgi:alkanesulfonate monooxygenase SsuD/methylene tetrahydromethanopterin reductase-like flavin-dependent oxidoreductase (luciferase family)